MKTGSTYLVDTNIIIDFFGGEPALKDKFSEKSIVIPSVVVGELYYGAFASSQNEKKINELDEFLPDYEIISIDDDTARFYGEIKSVFKKKGYTYTRKRYLDLCSFHAISAINCYPGQAF